MSQECFCLKSVYLSWPRQAEFDEVNMFLERIATINAEFDVEGRIERGD